MKTALRYLLISSVAFAASLGWQEARAAAGDLYVGGDGDNVVYKFTPNGTRSTFATGVFADWVALDAQKNLFVSDTHNKLIAKITPDGTVTVFATGQNGEDFVPGGLAFDAAGNLYAANTSNGFIYQYTPAGVRSTFASGISAPAGLAFDKAGNLFVSEVNTGHILEIPPAGGAPTLFATGFMVPEGLAFDSAGTLYEADFGTGRVLKVASNGTSTVFASSLVQPRALAFDANGNLFVSTIGNQEIVKIAPDGTQTMFASGIHADGLAFEPPPAAILVNISTRAFVQTGDNVLIGGFVISGNVPKKVLIRAIGPSLPAAVPNRMQDPMISLHDSTTAQIATNDNWQSDPNAGQIPANLQPGDPRESAILITLQPGAYTAIVSGVGGTTGVALVEVYDMDPAATSELENISTRGLVQTGDFVMIGGFVTGGTGNIEVLIRALGPSLTAAGIANPLPDPTVRMFNANGMVIGFNDNWQDTQAAEIMATGKAPTSNLESAILMPLAPGGYTAIVSDKNGANGIGEVEVFKIQ
jgi:sugar lactone lactonase YvrE